MQLLVVNSLLRSTSNEGIDPRRRSSIQRRKTKKTRREGKDNCHCSHWRIFELLSRVYFNFQSNKKFFRNYSSLRVFVFPPLPPTRLSKFVLSLPFHYSSLFNTRLLRFTATLEALHPPPSSPFILSLLPWLIFRDDHPSSVSRRRFPSIPSPPLSLPLSPLPRCSVTRLFDSVERGMAIPSTNIIGRWLLFHHGNVHDSHASSSFIRSEGKRTEERFDSILLGGWLAVNLSRQTFAKYPREYPWAGIWLIGAWCGITEAGRV